MLQTSASGSLAHFGVLGLEFLLVAHVLYHILLRLIAYQYLMHVVIRRSVSVVEGRAIGAERLTSQRVHSVPLHRHHLLVARSGSRGLSLLMNLVRSQNELKTCGVHDLTD